MRHIEGCQLTRAAPKWRRGRGTKKPIQGGVLPGKGNSQTQTMKDPEESGTLPTNQRPAAILHFMPRYRFIVHNSHRHDDPEETELPDDEAARVEARQIIRELKQNNDEGRWKGWTIEVMEGDRQAWQIPFIGVE